MIYLERPRVFVASAWEFLKTGDKALTIGLHAFPTTGWLLGTIPPNWKRTPVVPNCKGKGNRQNCNGYCGNTRGKVCWEWWLPICCWCKCVATCWGFKDLSNLSWPEGKESVICCESSWKHMRLSAGIPCRFLCLWVTFDSIHDILFHLMMSFVGSWLLKCPKCCDLVLKKR